MKNDSILRDLSMHARLAIALHCLKRYCAIKGLAHPSIDEFAEYLWEGLEVKYPDWMDWYRRPPLLLRKSRNEDTLPFDLNVQLEARGIVPREFSYFLDTIQSVHSCSYFAGDDDEYSTEELMKVLRFSLDAGVELPSFEYFGDSRRTTDRGNAPSPSLAQVERWRRLE